MIFADELRPNIIFLVVKNESIWVILSKNKYLFELKKEDYRCSYEEKSKMINICIYFTFSDFKSHK